MSKIQYTNKRFNRSSVLMIKHANEIIDTYMTAGYKLTLRQLYYQFVSRGLIPNKVQEYKNLGRVVSEGRLNGLIDWNAIEDRTRNLHTVPWWTGPESIIESAANSYAIDKWRTQDYRVEVWVEKEALAGVFERACAEYSIPFFCCKGYTSQSEMWGASMRLRRYVSNGQIPLILHFGDHDPSGIDMTRDITDRLATFRCDLEVDRLALNMDQVNEYQPPPNPAKETDSRFKAYMETYGDESWELDALEPQVLGELVKARVEQVLNLDEWAAEVEEENTGRTLLEKVSKHWPKVVKRVEKLKPSE